MTELWTNDRDTLAEALFQTTIDTEEECRDYADHLIDSGAVRVLDPDNTELVERVAAVLSEANNLPWDDELPAALRDSYRGDARVAIEALRQS